MTEPLAVAVLKAAEVLAPDLVKAGARGLGREILGTPAERGLQGVYARAIVSLLVKVGQPEEAAGGGPDPEALKVVESVLGGLCSDEEAAGLLLNIALRPGPVPVEALCERAAYLGYEPDTLPLAFYSAMWVLAKKVWEEFLAEARKENSPIHGLINEELLASVRTHHEALQAAASTAEQGNLLPPPPGLVLGRAPLHFGGLRIARPSDRCLAGPRVPRLRGRGIRAASSTSGSFRASLSSPERWRPHRGGRSDKNG